MKRAFLAILVATNLVASSGIVGYVPAWEGDEIAQGDLFPCRDHRCGCKTPEDCRRRCCCFPRRLRGLQGIEIAGDAETHAVLAAFCGGRTGEEARPAPPTLDRHIVIAKSFWSGPPLARMLPALSSGHPTDGYGRPMLKIPI